MTGFDPLGSVDPVDFWIAAIVGLLFLRLAWLSLAELYHIWRERPAVVKDPDYHVWRSARLVRKELTGRWHDDGDA